MQVALPELADDEAYFAFCVANPDLRIERTSEGEIVIAPPAGGESSYRSGLAFEQLFRWARRDPRGKAYNSSTEFMLPGAVSRPIVST